MKKTKAIIILISVLAAGLAATSYTWATPSADFYEEGGDILDSWGVRRTTAIGEDGFYQLSETSFRPVIAYESLGKEAALAYSLGEQIAAQYPDRIERAEAIFRFVQDRVVYTSDIDQFDYEEFAQNADEMAITIDQDGVGYGDCEDSAVLLAVMYKGAGYRSAIAVGKGHTASLVHLPEYEKATAVFELGGEPGWLWAEATGKTNPLGWAPKEFINAEIDAYEIGEEEIDRAEPPTTPSVAITKTGGGGTSSSRPFPFFGIVMLLWIFPMFRRRRRRRR